jgi:hypothetical protein
MKNLNFYTQPFHLAKYGSWVYDSKSNFVFQFDEKEKYNDKGRYIDGLIELRREIISSLNFVNHKPIKELNLSVNPNDETEIFNNGELFITIRGWGNLTGVGGYNFKPEKAAKIQNDFRDWIIYKLSCEI